MVVEAAGGLLVPLARAPLSLDQTDPADRAPSRALLTNLDLAVRLALPVVLVGRAGLGTLNHCALSARVLQDAGLTIAAIVLNRLERKDHPSVATNPKWVEEMTGARVLGPTRYMASPAGRPAALGQILAPLVP
jgi:dethiobiotin synthetase